MSPNHRSAESKISVDRKRPIQGLLRLHTRYGPPDRSAALRRPLSRGSNPCSCPHEPLVSYRINRQLSGWNPPPLMMRAFGAHCHFRTSCSEANQILFDHLVDTGEECGLDVDAERPGSFEVDDELKFCRLLHG